MPEFRVNVSPDTDTMPSGSDSSAHPEAICVQLALRWKVGKELKSSHARMSSIWRFPPERNNPHPAPYPLVLPLRIILSMLDKEQGVVLDPYMGSGTTAVAAKLLGSDYVGIDISQKYIDDANIRIDNFESEKSVLEEEEKLHVINNSYKDRKRKQAEKNNVEVSTIEKFI